MKSIYLAFLWVVFFTACHHSNKPIVDASITDSLVAHYSPSIRARTSDSNLDFWKRRMDIVPLKESDQGLYSQMSFVIRHQSSQD